jgi:hypothetical protein
MTDATQDENRPHVTWFTPPVPTFKIGDIVLYEGRLYVFEGYIGKTGRMAQIARKQRDGDDYPVRRVYVTSLTDANEVEVTAP